MQILDGTEKESDLALRELLLLSRPERLQIQLVWTFDSSLDRAFVTPVVSFLDRAFTTPLAILENQNRFSA